MKTGLALIAMGVTILIYLWASLTSHGLFYENDRAIVQTVLLIGLIFIAFGIGSYFLS